MDASSSIDMSSRVARYGDLEVMDYQTNKDLPQDVRDIVWARKIMPVIAYDSQIGNPFGTKAPIDGASGMTMLLATCPPGQGPGLHKHHRSYETFTVMQGTFEFSWGDEGENTVVLGEFDTLSVPPGPSRAFRNIGSGEGVLQVIITGGKSDLDDITFPPLTAERISALGPNYLEHLEKSGMSFER